MQIRLEGYTPGRFGGSIAMEDGCTYQTLFRMGQAIAEYSRGRSGVYHRHILLNTLQQEIFDNLNLAREILRLAEIEVEAFDRLLESIEVEYLEGMMGTD